MALGRGPALLADALDQALHALTADLGSGGGDGGERNIARPGERVAVAAADADVAGDVEALRLKARDDACRQHVGEADDEVGALAGVALGQPAAELEAVRSGVPAAFLDYLELDALLGRGLAHALGSQEQLCEVGGADHADAAGVAVGSVAQQHATLGQVVRGHVDAGGVAVDIEVDGGDGGLLHRRRP